MFHLVDNHRSVDIHNSFEIFLKNKTPDCIIYSEDGAKFRTHKELFGQTKFMRELLKSQSCCGLLEVILPCSKEELGHLINFLHDGKIECEKKIDSLKIIENLNKILGYPDDYIDNIRRNVLDEILGYSNEYIDEILIDVLDKKENNDSEVVFESSDNENSKEPIKIVQEVNSKKRVLTESEQNESDSVQRSKKIKMILGKEYYDDSFDSILIDEKEKNDLEVVAEVLAEIELL